MRYKIYFEYLGLTTLTWIEDYLDNNGKGFTWLEARQLRDELKARDNVKWVQIVEID